MKSSGLIQIYTGNGKGKTTAALGLAFRARATGKRVAIVFFDKGGDHYTERGLLTTIGVDWFGYGCDRIDPRTNRFRFGVMPEDTAAAEQGIAKALAIVRTRQHDLVILDEVNTTVALGMLNAKSVERVIDEKADECELVCTGRTEVTRPRVTSTESETGGSRSTSDRNHGLSSGLWLSYFDRADLITDMRLVEHYFYQGTPARAGIDF